MPRRPSRRDLRYLACLDRALAIAPKQVIDGHETIDEEAVIEIANSFYDAWRIATLQ